MAGSAPRGRGRRRTVLSMTDVRPAWIAGRPATSEVTVEVTNPFDGSVVGAHAVPHVFARLTGGTGPDGMAVDTAGNLYAAHFRAGEVVVIDRNGFHYGSIKLPTGAGLGTTNIAFHNGYLYITEAFEDEIWRVRTTVAPLPTPNLR